MKKSRRPIVHWLVAVKPADLFQILFSVSKTAEIYILDINHIKIV